MQFGNVVALRALDRMDIIFTFKKLLGGGKARYYSGCTVLSRVWLYS